jgi:hypothetical protein
MSKIEQIKIPIMGEPIIQSTCDECKDKFQEEIESLVFEIETLNKQAKHFKERAIHYHKLFKEMRSKYIEEKEKYEKITANYTMVCQQEDVNGKPCGRMWHGIKEEEFCPSCRRLVRAMA